MREERHTCCASAARWRCIAAWLARAYCRGLCSACSFALSAMLLALAPAASQASVRPLPAPVQQQLRDGGFWQRGCPVALSTLRLPAVTQGDFRGQKQTGQLIVNKTAARGLDRVFGQLYELHFPI